MLVMAFAGTGKTTTLVEYTKRRPHLRFAYLAFNVSVMDDAKAKFPPHVTCVNFHKLAHAKVVQRWKSRES
jgi:F-box protein 18 (helicase)